MSDVLKSWHPVTSDFGLIQAPIEEVVTAFTTWQRSIEIEHARTQINLSLADAFESLLPLANSKMRCLFIQTQSPWVAFFQNGIQGSDPFPVMAHLAKKMGVLAMRVCCTLEKCRYPAVIWEVYAPESLGSALPLCYRRSIAAANDGGKWRFEESGERYPFELAHRYTLPRKRDRFTSDMLREYLSNFGIELLSDDFMQVSCQFPAVRLQRVTKVWNAPEFSLEQVIAGLPWQRK